MAFVRLSLENFRRFSKADFSFPESGVTLIDGPNGAGKSTILEAVYLLCMGRTPRDTPPASLIHRTSSAGYFRVEGEHAGEPALSAEAGIRAVAYLTGGSIVYREDDKPLRRSDLIGKPPVVLFSAEEMRLVTGEPALRRRMMDRILSQQQPEYLSRLKRYTRTLAERNALLRSAEDSPPDASALLALDETLSADGDWIVRARRTMILEINTAMPGKLTGLGAAHLASRVRIDLIETAHAGLMNTLIDQRTRDLAAGHTTAGPHRDDFQFLDELNACGKSAAPPERPTRIERGLPASDVLSQGETRILSLALKCIEADRLDGGNAVRLRRTRDGADAADRLSKPARPVLLFDDLFSELDELRRDAVTAFMVSYAGQVLLTTCLPPPPSLTASVCSKVSLS